MKNTVEDKMGRAILIVVVLAVAGIVLATFLVATIVKVWI